MHILADALVLKPLSDAVLAPLKRAASGWWEVQFKVSLWGGRPADGSFT